MEIELADGTILEFPDGTDPKVIDKAVKAHIASQRPQLRPAEPPEASSALGGVKDILVGSLSGDRLGEIKGGGEKLRKAFIQWLVDQKANEGTEQAELDAIDAPREMGWGDLAEMGGLAAGAHAAVQYPMATLFSAGGTGVGRRIGRRLTDPLAEALDVPDFVRDQFEGVTEGVGGAVGGTVGGGLPAIAKRGGISPEAIRKSGRESYAKTTVFDPKDVQRVQEYFRGIEDELPVGVGPFKSGPLATAGAIRRQAEKKAIEAGSEIDRVYRQNAQPVDIRRMTNQLDDAIQGNVRTPEYMGIDPQTGQPYTVPARYEDPAFNNALRGRRADLVDSDIDFFNTKGGMDTADALRMRQTADHMINRRDSRSWNKKAADQNPVTQGWKAQRTALADELHTATGGPEGAGAKADRAFSAWQELKKAGKLADMDASVRRWAFARSIPGPVGSAIGIVASRTTPFRTLSGQTKFAVARALDRGDQAAFMNLWPSILRELGADEEPTVPVVDRSSFPR